MFGRTPNASRLRAALIISAAIAGLCVCTHAARADELPGLNGAPPPIVDQASPQPTATSSTRCGGTSRTSSCSCSC